MTIEQNLNKLIETKESIKNSIINKGVSVSDADSFASYADKISEINQSKDCPIYKSQEKTTTITKNGHSVVTPDSNFDGLSSVDITVDVPIPTYTSQHKNYIITENGTTSISPDSGFNGISGGTITVDVPTLPSGGDGVYFDFTDCKYLDSNSGFAGNIYLTRFTQELPNVTTLQQAFQNCINLTEFTSKIPKINDINLTFRSCTKLKTFDSDLSTATYLGSAFDGCSSLTTFNSNLSGMYSENNAISMFYGCKKLTNVTLTGTLSIGIDFSVSTLLTVESMLSIMNALIDLTGQGSKTMKFGATNLGKLTDEQKAIATNKNWILS